MSSENQQLLRPRKSDIVKTHSVEECDPVLRLEWRPVIEGPEVPINLLLARNPGTKAAHHNHRELQSFRLVDRHHLYMTLREGQVWILVLVDAAVVE